MTRDPRTRKDIECRFDIAEFIERLSHHVPGRYRHNVRYFGLLAPRCKGRLYAFVFHLLDQKRRTKPRPLSWARALRKYFGVDPLVDSNGIAMRWVRRLGASS